MGARIGWKGYARILGMVRLQAVSVRDLAAEYGCRQDAMGTVVRGMRSLGLVHIASWTEPEKHGPACSPCIRLGPGDEVPPPLTCRGGIWKRAALWAARARPHASLIAFGSVIRLMREQPRSRAEIANLAGPQKERLGQMLHALLVERLIFIALYRRSKSGPPAAFYSFGAGASVPRPVPVGVCERRRRLKGLPTSRAMRKPVDISNEANRLLFLSAGRRVRWPSSSSTQGAS